LTKHIERRKLFQPKDQNPKLSLPQVNFPGPWLRIKHQANRNYTISATPSISERTAYSRGRRLTPIANTLLAILKEEGGVRIRSVWSCCEALGVFAVAEGSIRAEDGRAEGGGILEAFFAFLLFVSVTLNEP